MMDKPETGNYWTGEVSGVFMLEAGLLLLAFTAKGLINSTVSRTDHHDEAGGRLRRDHRPRPAFGLQRLVLRYRPRLQDRWWDAGCLLQGRRQPNPVSFTSVGSGGGQQVWSGHLFSIELCHALRIGGKHSLLPAM